MTRNLFFVVVLALGSNTANAQFFRDVETNESANLLSVETISRMAVGVPFYLPSYSLCYDDSHMKVSGYELVGEESDYLVNLRGYRNSQGAIELKIEKGKRQDHGDLIEFVYRLSNLRNCEADEDTGRETIDRTQLIDIISIDGFNSLSLLIEDLLKPAIDVERSVDAERSDDVIQSADNSIFLWDISESNDEITDQPAVFVSTFASEKVGTIGLSWHPYITFRCMRNKTALFISIEDFQIEDRLSVSYRVDGEAAVNGTWRVASNRKAVGLWNGGDSIPVLKRLYRGESATFRVEGDDDMYTFSVPLAGSRAGIEKIASACNWELN